MLQKILSLEKLWFHLDKLINQKEECILREVLETKVSTLRNEPFAKHCLTKGYKYYL